jgi:hypothetical protein
MEVPIKKTAVVRNILVIFGCAIFATTVYVEFRHWYNFGHLVTYGLHVDALSEYGYIAIPGQTKMYWPVISNFSLVPVRLPACRPVSDTLNPPLEYAYAIQRFDEQSKSWQTIVDATKFEFCVNPFNNESGLAHTYLLPGSSVKVMSGSAVGAMKPFRKNDLARWIVFRQVFPSANWNTAVASMPFRIEDDVQRNEDGSFSVEH